MDASENRTFRHEEGMQPHISFIIIIIIIFIIIIFIM